MLNINIHPFSRSKSVVLESSFETFNSHDYLQEYYTEIDSENEQLLNFYAKTYKTMKQPFTMLEFGGGPTIYSLLSASERASEIHFSDYLDNNLEEVRLWTKNDPKAFNWDIFVKRSLELEGKESNKKAVEERKNILRSKLKKFIFCDAYAEHPLGENTQLYDVVSVNFVPESITSSITDWDKIISNISSLLRPRGKLILTSLKHSNHYVLGGKHFPAVSIDEADIIEVLMKYNYNMETIKIKEIEADKDRGYGGMVFVAIDKKLNL